MVIYGSEIAKKLREELKEKIAKLKRKPKLAVVLIGNDPASMSYVKGKIKASEEVGIEIENIQLKENISEEEVKEVIKKLNNDNNIDGILIQLPLPKHLNKDNLLNLIDTKKDVDGFTSINTGKLYQGIKTIYPCTPKGIIHLIESVTKIEGKNAVVIGRSNTVGLPTAKLLLDKNASVSILHSKTENIAKYTKSADIIVCAVGKPNTLTKEMVSKKAIIIDVGINRLDDKIVGDTDFLNLKPYVKAITPVPKGVGPMTIYMLLENTYNCYLDKEATCDR